MIPRPTDTTIESLEQALDAASPAERVDWLHSLGKKDMSALFAMTEGRDVSPEYFEHVDGGELVFHGKNSLPLFNRFKKAFRRHEGRIQGWNVNQGVARWFGGPGHFLVRHCDSWEGKLIFDYIWEVDTVPEGFPAPASNRSGTYKLVYGNMEDVIHRVSKDIIISKAFRAKKAEGVFFALCRPESAA